MPIAKTIYVCEYCNRRRLQNKSRIVAHEKTCWHNPDNKSCPTCLHQEISLNGFICYKLATVREFKKDPPATNCEHWKSEYDYEESEDFSE